MQRTWACLGRSTLLESVFVEHESTVRVQAPLYKKNLRLQLCVEKETRICTLNFLRLYLLLPAGMDNQIVKNDAVKTQIVEITKILNVTQEFLLACLLLTQNNQNFKNTAVTLVIEI